MVILLVPLGPRLLVTDMGVIETGQKSKRVGRGTTCFDKAAPAMFTHTAS